MSNMNGRGLPNPHAMELEGKAVPEVALYRAVIVQAFEDATMNIRPVHHKGIPIDRAEMTRKMTTNSHNRDMARLWLMRKSKDFRDVCEMALLDPDAVHEKALAMYHVGWPKRPRRYERTQPRTVLAESSAL